ncbi:MAG: N-formylglutamate amidohydrolase [Alphaproteobacteria bacterium]
MPEPMKRAGQRGEGLIAADEPPPYEIVNAQARTSVVFVCDHASRAIPRALGNLGLSQEALSAHIAWDIGAAEVTRRLSRRFDAVAALAGYSRLVIDLNRALDDPTSIAVISDGTLVPGNRALDHDAARLRADAIFHPYHRAVGGALEALRRQGHVPALVSIHTFTPVFRDAHRPWDVGVLWDKDGRMAVPFMDKLRTEHGLDVGDNLPYSGRDHYAFTVDHHAAASGLPHLSMEIRNDLVASEAGAEKFARLIGDVIEEIVSDPTLFREEIFPE